MPKHVADCCPKLCSRLWAELDIIPLVLPDSGLFERNISQAQTKTRAWDAKTIDEQAEAMSRKCVR
jgi:hypothetical protein